MVTIRAVYRNGQLEPLDPVPLNEGDEVELNIAIGSSTLRDAVSDLLVNPLEGDSAELDEEITQTSIDKALAGKRPLSEIIIEERRQSDV